jgi:hypothetical protein
MCKIQQKTEHTFVNIIIIQILSNIDIVYVKFAAVTNTRISYTF